MLVATPFGDRLRQLREAAGLTRYALAKNAGVTEKAIRFLEDGDRNPAWETVRKIARALNVSVVEFDVGDPPAEEGEVSAPPAPEPPPAPPRRRGKK